MQVRKIAGMREEKKCGRKVRKSQVIVIEGELMMVVGLLHWVCVLSAQPLQLQLQLTTPTSLFFTLYSNQSISQCSWIKDLQGKTWLSFYPFLSFPDLDVLVNMEWRPKVPVMSWQSCTRAAKSGPGSSTEAPVYLVYLVSLTGRLSAAHGPGLLSAVPPAEV
ncbi:hypothetical protein CONLIGDRAFT_61568 [Coniochaeta ligniaria NRRL 30616]|uniref:Uncharacterized protein n=1 Tax=Coniochaeta ligniaria NRRL 30616 TaxID=1408157 RepID=A0A1J7JZC1_9PEZI|nr:hypothetical protein CONLIGDRAFT_61568 [Coniochaeta ligniaria NRRL 30616]